MSTRPSKRSPASTRPSSAWAFRSATIVFTPAGAPPGRPPSCPWGGSWRPWHSSADRSVPRGNADDVQQRGAEPGGVLHRAAALEVHARAALVRLVGGIEGDGDAALDRALAHGERLAHALVAQTRQHEEQPSRVGDPETRKAGLVEDDLHRGLGHRLAPRVPDVAEHRDTGEDPRPGDCR